jgi:hypothetical protein
MQRTQLIMALGFAALVPLGLGGCGAVTGPPSNTSAVSTGSLNSKPLAERMVSKASDLKSETPKSLALQNAGVLVARVYGEKTVTTGVFGFGEKKPVRAGLLLSLASADRGNPALPMLFGQDTASTSEQFGWAITAVPPGKYYLSSLGGAEGYAAIFRTRNGNLAEAPGQTIDIKAGEVVYIGSVHTRADGKDVTLKVDDETTAAKSYLQTELGALAAVMTTRLLDCGCGPKRGPAETARRQQDPIKSRVVTAVATAKTH